MTTKEAIIKEFLTTIGSLGGKKSRRKLTPEQARAMVRAREAKRRAKWEEVTVK